MKRLAVLLILLCVVFGNAFTQADNEFAVLAKEIIGHFENGNFDKIYEQFDDKMKQAISEQQLANVWDGVEQQAGQFQEIEEVKIEQVGVYQMVNNISVFEKGKFNIQISYNTDKQISGLYILPTH